MVAFIPFFDLMVAFIPKIALMATIRGYGGTVVGLHGLWCRPGY